MPHKYTDEEKAFFIEYVPGHSYKEIREEYIKRFKCDIRLEQVKTYITNHKLSTGRTGRFEKGNTPVNKGKKMSPELYAKAYPTMFKKGHTSANKRPVGSERITRDGYIEVKVQDPNKWRLKHIVVWESHNGKVPPKHCILFLDRDTQNCSIDNLICISRNILRIINKSQLLTSDPKINKTVIILAEYMAKNGFAKIDVNERSLKLRTKRLNKEDANG